MSEIRKRTVGDASTETRDVSDNQVNGVFFIPDIYYFLFVRSFSIELCYIVYYCLRLIYEMTFVSHIIYICSIN